MLALAVYFINELSSIYVLTQCVLLLLEGIIISNWYISIVSMI